MHSSKTSIASRCIGISVVSALLIACGSAENPDANTTRDAGDAGATQTDVPNGTDVPSMAIDVPNGLDIPSVQVDVPNGADVPNARDVPNGADVPNGGPGPCGANVPENNSSCNREGLVCQYGNDPREGCRTTATCNGGMWQLAFPRCPSIVPPAMCPATREAAQGMACSPMSAVCAYDGLFCQCTNCRSFPVERCDGPTLWRCNAPNVAPNCPAVQPNLGSVCSSEGMRCGYDCEAYGVNGGRVCTGGVWTASHNDCPLSSRRAKRDIVYLNDQESERIAQATLRTRLATYEYTDPALRGSRRLGFILEDPTTHPYARDPDVSVVDMYGYSSMLLATVQSQQRQIEQLQREVRALQSASRARTNTARPSNAH